MILYKLKLEDHWSYVVHYVKDHQMAGCKSTHMALLTDKADKPVRSLEHLSLTPNIFLMTKKRSNAVVKKLFFQPRPFDVKCRKSIEHHEKVKTNKQKNLTWIIFLFLATIIITDPICFFFFFFS